MVLSRSFRLVLVALAIAFVAATRSMPQAAADELFAADRATDRILAFDPATGALTRVLVDEGSLNLPTSLAFGFGGDLFVGMLGGVARVNPVTGATSMFAVVPNVIGGLAYDPGTNTLFASEFGNFDGDEIFQYNSTGALIRTIGTGSGATGRAGLAIRGGDLYASHFGSGMFFDGSVVRYDSTNNYASLGAVASDNFDFMNQFDPALQGANGLAFDAAGNLVVVGLIGQSVMKFSLAGGPATSGVPFAIPVPYPSAVLIDNEAGNEVIYITTLGNDNLSDQIYGNVRFPGSILKYDLSDGTLIGGQPLVSSGGVADFNNDGIVDGDDLTKWSEEFADTGVADADNDLDTDGDDFVLWQRNLGRLGDFQPTALALYKPELVAEAVPEPAGAMLALVAATAFARSRRRRR